MKRKKYPWRTGILAIFIWGICMGVVGCGLFSWDQPVEPWDTESQEQTKDSEDWVEQNGTAADGAEQAGTGEGDAAQSEVEREGSEQTQAESFQDSEESILSEDDRIYITISAAGDVTLGNTHVQDYNRSFRQMYDSVEDKSYFFENVYEYFSQDDMTIVNLEGTLTLAEEMREDSTYNIKGDPEYAQILTLGDVEAVSMANNHRKDYLEQGCADTEAAITGEGIVWAYDNNVGIYETKGIKIGFISVNEVAWGKNIMNFVKKGMQKLDEAEVDIRIVCCHWGIEREYFPEQDQMDLGRQCIDAGADLVLGHHPHVLQGIEQYNGKYIVYSLGNFCFGANRNPADKDTMIFQQTFILEEGQETVAGEARVIPCFVSSVQNRNDFKPTPAEGEDRERIREKINDCSKYFGVAVDEDGTLISVPALEWPVMETPQEETTEAATEPGTS